MNIDQDLAGLGASGGEMWELTCDQINQLNPFRDDPPAKSQVDTDETKSNMRYAFKCFEFAFARSGN